MRTALAEHFSDLNPKPIGGAPRELVAAGKAIYEEGVPDANVPACAACHGPEAKGSGPIPRLAGQLNPYIIKGIGELEQRAGSEPDSTRHISHHAADCAQLDQVTNRSRRRLSQLSGVTPCVVQIMKFLKSAIAVLAIVSFSVPSLAGEVGGRLFRAKIRGQELHLVPRAISARFRNRATIGRADTPIPLQSTSGFSSPHAR